MNTKQAERLCSQTGGYPTIRREWRLGSLGGSLCVLTLAVVLVFASPIHSEVTAAGGATDHELFMQNVKKVADLFANGQMTPKHLSEILGGELKTHQIGKSWALDAGSCEASIVVAGSGIYAKVSELSLFPKPLLNVNFQDVERIFGKWEKIHESKTSSVRFDYCSSIPQSKLKIFVQTLFPPRVPDAPVLSITMRAESSLE
ncbi:MAG: hypothetical protein AB2L11_00485 [Syntrophobacteraceae bacterium]